MCVLISTTFPTTILVQSSIIPWRHFAGVTSCTHFCCWCCSSSSSKEPFSTQQPKWLSLPHLSLAYLPWHSPQKPKPLWSWVTPEHSPLSWLLSGLTEHLSCSPTHFLRFVRFLASMLFLETWANFGLWASHLLFLLLPCSPTFPIPPPPPREKENICNSQNVVSHLLYSPLKYL